MKRCAICRFRTTIFKHNLCKDRNNDKQNLKELPFHNIAYRNLYFVLNGKSSLQNLPSFSIQSLLDKMPGYKDSDSDFLHNSITSNYYSPTDFLRSKVSKTGFSVFHLNIASLTY